MRFGLQSVAGCDCRGVLWHVATVAALLIAMLCPRTGVAQSRLSDRVVAPIPGGDTALFVSDHINPVHFRLLVQLVAMSARVPIGFEELASEPEPFDGDLSRIPPERKTSLVGLTVGRALDRMVAVDRRYAWREQGGLLFLRPLLAWTDTNHFLHRRLAPFKALRRPPGDIAVELYTRLGAPAISGGHGTVAAPLRLPAGDERAISVAIDYGTALDVLNATVLAHGQLGWRVYYHRGPAEPINSCLRFITFDGEFSEIGSAPCGTY
jgi:hypothetical protein